MEHIWIELIGYGGTACTIISYSMRTIVPLRIASIASSGFFIGYGLLLGAWPIVLMELVILPLNVIRLTQILRMIREVDRAASSNLSLDWLSPFTHDRRHAAGDILFKADDTADYLLIIKSGRYRLVEANIELGPEQIVGEMGFLSAGNRRTMTLVCIEAGEVGRVTYADIKLLYFQNPAFGFSFMRLISERLFQNIEMAKAGTLAAVTGISPRPIDGDADPDLREAPAN